ncbi:APC family permease [Sulfurisphaera ohwakuensis]|uniref:Amino acid permease n=1 Tax=Sulfurisphaera ohwakuensis TaxID=69656 RepID=A0A650CFP2_SULOH|nr:APC family permease [Sulfurisphaera ohwakuensis]MBB5255091.1 amino acid transporter [Sulfurisphaera ohwakuensis]QGR16485.1 amino acid permease [Sulfurisphaera ohwakuensis]
MSQQEVPRLKKGQVSTLGALVEEIAAMAPACDVVAFITSAIAYAFALTPLAFLLATLAMYLEVNTLYHLAKRHASAGGYYGYIANAFGPVPATISGLLYVLYQVTSTAAIPTYIGGAIIPAFLDYYYHIVLPSWLWLPLILVFVIVPITLAIIGIRPQITTLKFASLFEVTFLAIIGAIVIAKAPDNTLAVFNPFAWPQYAKDFAPYGGPAGALGLAMVFSITSFIGYGGSAPLGEEVEHPKQILRALSLGVFIVGAVLTEMAYGIVAGWGVNNLTALTNNPNPDVQAIPGIIVMGLYLGIIGSMGLFLVAMNSAFSDAVAMQSNAGRVYFSMARDNVIPKWFSKIHPKYHTPYRALTFIGIASSISAILTAFAMFAANGLNPIQALTTTTANANVLQALADTFEFLTTMALFGMVLTHFLLNTSLITLFFRLKEKHKDLLHAIFHILQHYIAPAVATGILGYALYASIWPPVLPETPAGIISIAFLAFATGYAIYLKIYKPHVLTQAGKKVNLWAEEGESSAKNE